MKSEFSCVTFEFRDYLDLFCGSLGLKTCSKISLRGSRSNKYAEFGDFTLF